MFEHHKEPLAPQHVFFKRIIRSVAVGLLIIAIALSVGISGYHFIEGLPWVDSFLEAAMILAGMGPSAVLHTTAGKLFAGIYALVCGLLLVFTVGITFAPFIHRFFHKMHVDVDAPKPKQR